MLVKNSFKKRSFTYRVTLPLTLLTPVAKQKEGRSMSEENRSDQYTPGHKPDMKTLFKDNRVKGIAGIAAIAVIWAIMAQSNSGTHQERV